MGRTEIRLTGFGGQGIVLSGYIIGTAAAIHDKKEATFTQSYGPESRGGACSAQVIISDEPVHYPHLIAPSILVVMSQEAYYKYAPTLSDGALLIVDEDLVEIDDLVGDVKLLSVPATRLAEELGRKIVANIVMLGFFAAVTDVVSVEAMREAILSSVPKGTEELNLRAFEKGYEYGSGIRD
ncbi:MAG: pyruvate ferredoxin oxidoreductase [Chloroflexi bacterium]|nr:pyruvate ferredoxin oxidoreductase [Chloroflexota bacterium]